MHSMCSKLRHAQVAMQRIYQLQIIELNHAITGSDQCVVDRIFQRVDILRLFVSEQRRRGLR
jgi:hypothetical protein